MRDPVPSQPHEPQGAGRGVVEPQPGRVLDAYHHGGVPRGQVGDDRASGDDGDAFADRRRPAVGGERRGAQLSLGRVQGPGGAGIEIQGGEPGAVVPGGQGVLADRGDSGRPAAPRDAPHREPRGPGLPQRAVGEADEMQGPAAGTRGEAFRRRYGPEPHRQTEVHAVTLGTVRRAQQQCLAPVVGDQELLDGAGCPDDGAYRAGVCVQGHEPHLGPGRAVALGDVQQGPGVGQPARAVTVRRGGRSRRCAQHGDRRVRGPVAQCGGDRGEDQLGPLGARSRHGDRAAVRADAGLHRVDQAQHRLADAPHDGRGVTGHGCPFLEEGGGVRAEGVRRTCGSGSPTGR